MWFQTQTKTKVKVKTNPGREPTASRWSAPSPGKRTRREDHALLIVLDEFRTGYSLIGLLASRARLRFTGIARISAGQRSAKELSSNREVRLSPVSHRRGAPRTLRALVTFLSKWRGPMACAPATQTIQIQFHEFGFVPQQSREPAPEPSIANRDGSHRAPVHTPSSSCHFK